MEFVFWIVALAVTGVVSWILGSARAGSRKKESRSRDSSPAGGVELDPSTEVGRPSSPPDDSDLVLRSLARIRGYLEESVEAPLREARESGSLGRGVDDAVVGLEDLYFYLRPIPEERSSEDLNAIAKEAGGEYRREWNADVEVHVPERRTTVVANREALLDAVYLALHNAGTFGGGEAMEVVVRYQDGDCWLVVRDRGPGFTEEALRRGFEPFYTTDDSRLGLGLHQVRRIADAMDGRVAIRNRPGGGGQVEIVLPGRDD